MKKGLVVRAGAAALVSGMSFSSASAAPVLDLNTWNSVATDQRPVYWANANGGHQQSLAQSFVAGQSGLLTQIDLELTNLATPTNVSVTLWQGNIYSASAVQIGMSVQLSGFSGYFSGMPSNFIGKSIDFTDQGIMLQAGQAYSVVAAPIFGSPGIPFYQQGYTAWAVGLPSSGAGGAYSKIDSEGWAALEGITFGARTFVDAEATTVPEPATWAMMFAGISIMGFAMRRSNKKFDAKIKRMTAAVA